jgi:hypothetical protein
LGQGLATIFLNSANLNTSLPYIVFGVPAADLNSLLWHFHLGGLGFLQAKSKTNSRGYFERVDLEVDERMFQSTYLIINIKISLIAMQSAIYS